MVRAAATEMSANMGEASKRRGFDRLELKLRSLWHAWPTALAVVAGTVLALFVSTQNVVAQGLPSTCDAAAEIAVLPSPLTPWRGAPLRILVAAEKPMDGELTLTAPDGRVAAGSRERHG